MSKVNVGMVGLNFGRYIIDNMINQGAASPYFELAAVCRRDKAKCDEAAKKYGVKGYYEIEDLLADDDIPVIIDMTGPNGRADRIMQMIRAGKDVMSTKPFEQNSAKAAEVLFFPEHGEKHGYRWLLLALVSLHIAAMALFYWDSQILSVWSPLIIITGVGTFSDFLHRRFVQLKAAGVDNQPRAFWRRPELRLYYLPMTLILALTAGTILLRMSERLPPARPAPSAAMGIMGMDPDRYTYIVTPAPWLVAWHTGARTLWMPEFEHGMKQLDQRFGDRMATVYLPRNRAEILHDYLPTWWYLALRERNKLPSYRLADFSGYGEAVYLRRDENGTKP